MITSFTFMYKTHNREKDPRDVRQERRHLKMMDHIDLVKVTDT